MFNVSGTAWSGSDESLLSSLHLPIGQTNAQLTALFNSKTNNRRTTSAISNKVHALGLKKTSSPQPRAKSKHKFTTLKTSLKSSKSKPASDYRKEKRLGQRHVKPIVHYGREPPPPRVQAPSNDNDSDEESDDDDDAIGSEPTSIQSRSPTPTIRESSPVPPRDFVRSTAPVPSSRDRTTSPIITKERTSSRGGSSSSRAGSGRSSLAPTVTAPTSRSMGAQTESPPPSAAAQANASSSTQTPGAAEEAAARELREQEDAVIDAARHEIELWKVVREIETNRLAALQQNA